MAARLSDFSEVQLLAVYRCIEVEIFNEAQTEIASPLTSVQRLPELLRLPRRLIDEVVGFNSQYAEACVDKLRSIPGAHVQDPWSVTGEERLARRVCETVQRLAALLFKRWGFEGSSAAFFVDTAANELRQRICEEYETGRDAHWQALESLRRPQTQPAPSLACQPLQPALSSVHLPTSRRQRGLTTPERLEAMWRDPDKKIQVLAAGNAEGVGRLIGRSKTSVIDAGRIWDDEISPALASQRSLTRYHREENRLRH